MTNLEYMMRGKFTPRYSEWMKRHGLIGYMREHDKLMAQMCELADKIMENESDAEERYTDWASD